MPLHYEIRANITRDRSLLEAGLAPETDSPYTDSPYSVAILLLALGAMPVLAGDRPALDGTG